MKQAYRDDIYKNYAEVFKGATGTFDVVAARRYGKCLHYYLRNWLPVDYSAGIIDLGCGDGKTLYALQEKGYQNLTGVDRSQSQTDIASRVLTNIHLADVLEYLTENNTEYDLILAMDLIEHFTKDEALEFLRLCYSRLAHGGQIILQTPNASSPYFGTVRYGDFTHELAFTPILLGQLLQKTGFSMIHPREQTPIPFGYSMLSTIRFALWQFIRLLRIFVATIETGGAGSPILSRVFLITAKKTNKINL